MRSSASHLDVRDPSEPEDFGQTALRCMDRDSEVPAVRPGANFLEGAERSHAEDFDRRRGVGVFRKDRQVPVVPPKKEEDKTRDEERDEAGGNHEAGPSGHEEPTGAAGPHERSEDEQITEREQRRGPSRESPCPLGRVEEAYGTRSHLQDLAVRVPLEIGAKEVPLHGRRNGQPTLKARGSPESVEATTGALDTQK